MGLVIGFLTIVSLIVGIVAALSQMGVGSKGKVTRVITLNDGRSRTVVVPENETFEETWNRVTKEMGVNQPWVDPFEKPSC